VELGQAPLQGSVLIVDDSLAQLTAMREFLVRAGYAPIFAASDWAECRKALTIFAPSIIVIDVHLPGMVGGDVMATQLRRHPACAGSKILFHSGLSRRDLTAIVARTGADGFVEKGDLLKLVEAVASLVPPAPTVQLSWSEAAAGEPCPPAPAAEHAAVDRARTA
jgi:CheY-like chemotaxis protein